MIKSISILALIVLAQSAFLSEEELNTPANSFIDNVMKCFAEVKPVITEVPEIIKALKVLDFGKAIELVQKVALDGYAAIVKCYNIFAGETELGLSAWIIALIWKFGRGLLKRLKEFGIEDQTASINMYMDRHQI